MENTPPMAAPAESSGAVPPPPAPAADYVPAGFWIRAGAYLIDGLLLTICQAVIMTLLMLLRIPKELAQLVGILLGVGYFMWMPVACAGQTLGKMAAGVAIVRMDGSPLTYLRCLGRWFGYLASGLLAGIGFLIAAFTDKKRGLHDYIADTRVIYLQEVSTGRKAAVIILGLFFLLIPLVGIIAAVSIPNLRRYADMGQDVAAISQLGSLRSAVSISYGDNQGVYPTQLAELAPRYIPAIPTLRLKDHPGGSSEVTLYDAAVCNGGGVDPAKVKDTGRWGYVADPKATCNGSLFIDCSHPDAKQKPWASY